VQEGKYAEAESHLRRAIELCEKNWTPVTKSSALDAAEAMDHLATVLEKTGRKDEATKIASRSKEVRETKSLKPAKSAAQSAEGNAAK
jgi:Flp pilus assembly protein TadD